MSNSTLLEVNAVHFFYPHSTPQTPILNNIHLHLHMGETIAIIGKSGCGKSTLLKILAGCLKQSSGNILFRGKSYSNPLKEIALMMQDPILLPWRTVLENILYALEIQKVPYKERLSRAQDALESLEIVNFANRYPKEISGGQAQRAALARTLVCLPTILLLDEPFGAVDALTRPQLYAALRKTKKLCNSSIILVTHDLHEALELADRILIIDAKLGKITKEVNVKTLLETHQSQCSIENLVKFQAHLDLAQMLC